MHRADVLSKFDVGALIGFVEHNKYLIAQTFWLIFRRFNRRISITRSNLERRAAGRLIFLCGDSFLSYLPYRGFAAARIDVRAFNEVAIPALAIDTVYYSITSWIDVLSCSFILSNSSMQHTPMSASTRAPPSKLISPVIGSLMIEAVRPTPLEPLPVV